MARIVLYCEILSAAEPQPSLGETDELCLWLTERGSLTAKLTSQVRHEPGAQSSTISSRFVVAKYAKWKICTTRLYRKRLAKMLSRKAKLFRDSSTKC